MEIVIRIENQAVEILLKDNKKIIAKLNFPERHNLSERLLPGIDKLLKDNGLKPKDIKQLQLEAQARESYTTYRIAKAVCNGFNFARYFN